MFKQVADTLPNCSLKDHCSSAICTHVALPKYVDMPFAYHNSVEVGYTLSNVDTAWPRGEWVVRLQSSTQPIA